jgi:hypothetical protein
MKIYIKEKVAATTNFSKKKEKKKVSITEKIVSEKNI